MSEPNSSKVLFDFLRSFLMPTFIGKAFILYFGLHYSSHPGEGYGIGLIIAVIFTLTMLGLFFWKYRNTEDI